jgi:hypothetical protein
MAEKIFRGDSTDSFGQNWLIIEAEIPEDWVVSMAEFKVGNLPAMIFEEPEFPMSVNLSSAQTALLKDTNSCYLSLFDENGLKQTCEGTFIFETRKSVT